MFNDIIGKLKEKISTLPSIKAVYDYEAKAYDEYPCVVIVPVKYKDEYKSLGEIKRLYEFRIRILNYTDKLEDSLKDIQVALRKAVDDVIALLNTRENITLDGKVDFSQLTEGEFSFIEREGAYYVCQMSYFAFKSLNF
jgi:hypothetical protein